MIGTHALVLYKNQVAFVSEVDKVQGKYHITFAGGSQKVREKDITLLHADDKTLSSVSAAISFADALFADESTRTQNETALSEAALLLEGTQSSLAEIAGLVFGSFTALNAWATYRLVHETVWFTEEYVPRSQDEIEILRAKSDEKNRETEIRQAFLSRLKKKAIQLPDDAKYMQDIEALALGKTDKSKTLRDVALKETPEGAHALLLQTGYWTNAKNPHPSRYALSMNSATIGLENPPEELRLELDMAAFAIDNEWSIDPDDAVSFDGESLWVHVADPASTVVPDSAVDIAARKRGATLYIPEGASRMLAENSLESYALGLSRQSNALSFKITLDELGAIKDCAVFKTRLAVTRYTYAQVDDIYHDNTHEHHAVFATLFAIADKNIERRKKAGAVFIDLPELHILLDNTGEICLERLVQTESSVMVREMMMLACEAAARFAFKNNIPFPFVRQDTPDIPKDVPQGLAGQYRLRRCMRSRQLGITPSSHAGLGLGMYSQVTSPLRRYGDLLAHQQLRAFLSMQDQKNSSAHLKMLDTDTVLERISQGEAAAQATIKAERKSNTHWILVWLTRHPEWIGKAVVVEIKAGYALQPTVLIPELAQEAQIAVHQPVQLNDELYVKASAINIPELRVTYIEVKEAKQE